ncbi:hypothetical protein ACFOQM_21435 [Paenibacillus sp. GCM10012307]|uniref:Uncharacterized protein n=1 Tax=Paenibacillus roseus TaxID=2798579 RepID=A0A934JBJ4_9BACL|nr:hypothetical protein [Paenibacillus roseus]MBJ6363793.1 hypothetical protein [Paenibacillus roseus]
MSEEREQIAGNGQQAAANNRLTANNRPDSGKRDGAEDSVTGEHGKLPASSSAVTQPDVPVSGADPQWQELYAAIRKAVLELRSGT